MPEELPVAAVVAPVQSLALPMGSRLSWVWRVGFRAALGPPPRLCVDTTAAAEFPFRPGIPQEEGVVPGSVYIGEAIFRSHSLTEEL